MLRSSCLAATAMALFAQGAAAASAFYVDRAAFLAAAGAVTVEDFSGYAAGTNYPNPFTFSNGSFTGQLPAVADDALFCGSGGSCVYDNGSITGPRTIASRTGLVVALGFDIHAIAPNARFDIAPDTGNSTFDLSGLSFFGIVDPDGVSAITLRNVGNGTGVFANYSIDNVTVGARVVPEPASLPLLAAALFCFASAWRRPRG